jgi:hypothetical protein
MKPQPERREAELLLRWRLKEQQWRAPPPQQRQARTTRQWQRRLRCQLLSSKRGCAYVRAWWKAE